MPHLIVLTGPTGVGKTDLSLTVARRYGAPILNADSRQLYRDLPIGTAAPTPDQMAQARHYFVGTLDLTDRYSAARYEAEVMALLPTLWQQSDVAVLSGGSMMYIDAVCRGIDDIPTVDDETRRTLLRRYGEEGPDTLLRELRLLDPDYYHLVDKRNPRRILHALEICYMTGRTYTSFRTGMHHPRPFRIIRIGLMRPREELYRRIDLRVSAMLAAGLLGEARRVYPLRHLNALNTVGYKELFRHFDGEWTLPFATERICFATHAYCRKQSTWFRRDPDTRWFHPDDTPHILGYIDSQLQA